MDGCIFWPGRINKKGYAYLGGMPAYRLFYERNIGSIPSGYHVDHTCFVRDCINPAHLRLLLADENRSLQRESIKTHCINGHEFTVENTYIRPKVHRGGNRDCRTCIRDRVSRYKARRDAA
jgi:hypothetical protein